MALLDSPRARRRAIWIVGLAVVVGGVSAAVVVLPRGHQSRESFRPGAQVPVVERTVPMTKARKQAIDEILDSFVPAAVERHDPGSALPLVTQSFRAGISDSEWRRGDLPVLPYRASNPSFHAWTLNYSYPDEMSVELLLHPARGETLGAQAFTAVLKLAHGRWLLDSFVPSASFAPASNPSRIKAVPDYTPQMADRGAGALSAKWLLLPALVLALIVLVPIGIGVAKLRRSRRAWREYHAGEARLD